MDSYTLITGASGGIGYELAKVFARKKHNLILVARNEEKLRALREELEKQYSIIVKVISKENSAKELFFETCNERMIVDILVNNAGLGDCNCFFDSEWNRQKNMIDLNIISLMEMSYLYGNDMRKRGTGRILNLSSVAAFSAGPYMSIYYASKGFVLSFSEALAEELTGTGVTVTVLCPGPTSTGFEKNAKMKNSKMFTAFKTAKASQVAETGYYAVMKRKTVKYHGVLTILMNIGSRISPRYIARKFAKKINRIPEGK